jgi:O-Antigen ligase/Tetratricopeptide repeat
VSSAAVGVSGQFAGQARPAAATGSPELPGILLGLGLAVGLAGAAFGAAGGLRLEDAVPVELAVTAAGTALAAAAVIVGRGPVRVYGGVTLGLFGALTALTAFSIVWSDQPSDSWVEANRTLSYLAAFAGGVSLARLFPRRCTAFAGGVLGAAAAVCVYAMLSKTFAGTLDADAVISRLRAPFDYWNAIGLMGAMAVPLSLWLGARRDGHPLASALAYPALALAIVTMVLAYSRGALIAAVIGALLWFVLVPLRLRSVAVLGVAGAGAALVLWWGLNQSGLTADHIPLVVREETGSEFGVLLVLMGVLLYLGGLATGFAMARSRLSAETRRKTGTVVIVVAALIPVLALGAVALSSQGLGGTLDSITNPDAKVPSNGPDRLTATGSVRARYWRDALKVWSDNPILGAGAGAYPVARAHVRKDAIDVQHAHGFVVQTLADLGLVGLLVSLAALVAWVVAAARPLGIPIPEPFWSRGPPEGGRNPALNATPERAVAVAIAAVALTFGVHSFIDWTWFIPGTAVMGLVCAGWVAGRGPLDAAHRERPAGALWMRLSAAGGVAVLGLALLWAIWQPLRSDQADSDAVAALARGDVPAALAATQRAEDRDPLSVDPLFERATILESRGRQAAANAVLQRAIRLQPSNEATWERMAVHLFLSEHKPRAALPFARAAVFLDPHSVQARGILLTILRAQKTPPPKPAKPAKGKPLTTPGD